MVERGDIHAVKALVRNFKCSVSIRNNNGMKPVHLAIDKGHLGIVKYLMKQEQQLYSEGSESSSSREGNNTHKLGLSPDPVPNVTTGME